MLEEKRGKFKWIEIKTGEIFSKLRLSPSQLTFNSLIFALFSLAFLLNKKLILSSIFFIIATFFDFIDGAVAKLLKMETKKGAYLDTICDRYVEGIILFGFLFLPLKKFLWLPARGWIFLALFGSFATTYAKAAAKEKELITEELKKGLFGRAERVILIFLAMILGIFNFSWIIYPIIVLAIFANLTALQRIYLALKQSRTRQGLERQDRLKHQEHCRSD
jgi:phosphatidylglycerophosphate synthase